MNRPEPHELQELQEPHTPGDIEPLATFVDVAPGEALALPAALSRLYGRLTFPASTGQPYVIGNFVTTLDGVVALGEPDHSGGGAISGFNPHDRMVMGLLRAVADAVIVGAGTLRADAQHVWTPAHIYPPLTDAYQGLRRSHGMSEQPLTVIVTAHGELDLDLPVFQSGVAPVLIVTTPPAAARLPQGALPQGTRVVTCGTPDQQTITARDVLAAVAGALPNSASTSGARFVLEGGPHLMGDFVAESCLDELFLTLAPQIAGRDALTHRLGLVEGHRLAPDDPRWGRLVSLKQAGDYLFLRYAMS
ncbi:MAG: dihydrofolate reductase family protein [Ktedonobacterales bacterium]